MPSLDCNWKTVHITEQLESKSWMSRHSICILTQAIHAKTNNRGYILKSSIRNNNLKNNWKIRLCAFPSFDFLYVSKWPYLERNDKKDNKDELHPSLSTKVPLQVSPCFLIMWSEQEYLKLPNHPTLNTQMLTFLISPFFIFKQKWLKKPELFVCYLPVEHQVALLLVHRKDG